MLKALKDEKVHSIIKTSWALSWPLALIMFYEFLLGIADVYVAGKFGKTAQAAYGFAFQLYFVFIMIGIALSIGVVSVVSRLYTSGNSKGFDEAVDSSLSIVAVFGIIFGIAGVLFSKNLIDILNLPADIKPLVVPFMKIYSLAFLFDYILMSTNGIMRSCDMIKKSLLIMTIVCFMNIPLNFILAFATPLGLKGIAAATVISIATGAVLSLYYIKKAAPGFKFSFAIIKNILNISWPPALLQAFWQLGSIALFLILGLLPKNNVEIMAALTNGLKIESAIFLPVFAFNMANAVVVGNLLGKRQDEDAFRAGIITAIMGVAVTVVLTLFIMLNARGIAGFLSDNNAVVSESMTYIYIALISEPIMAWGVILGGGLNGAGDTISVMLATALTVWLVRLPLGYILGVHFNLGPIAIWWAMNLSVLAQAIIITKRYYNKRWIAQAERLVEA